MEKKFLVNYDEDKQIEDVFDGETYRFLDFYETVSLLNKQDEEIKKNTNALRGFIRNCGNASCELKNSKAIEVLRQLDEYMRKYVCSITTERDHLLQGYIQSRIRELKGE